MGRTHSTGSKASKKSARTTSTTLSGKARRILKGKRFLLFPQHPRTPKKKLTAIPPEPPLRSLNKELYLPGMTRSQKDKKCRRRYAGLSHHTALAVQQGLQRAHTDPSDQSASTQLQHLEDIARLVGVDSQRIWVWPDGTNATLKQYERQMQAVLRDEQNDEDRRGSDDMDEDSEEEDSPENVNAPGEVDNDVEGDDEERLSTIEEDEKTREMK